MALRSMWVSVWSVMWVCLFSVVGCTTLQIDRTSADEPEPDASQADDRDAGDGDAGVGEAGDGDAGVGETGDGDAGVGETGDGDAGAGDAGDGDAGVGETGDGDAGDRDAGPNDVGDRDAGLNAPPIVVMDFPRSGLTPNAALHVRGTVSDPDGDTIARLTVGGVEATIDGSDWSALVPLSIGDNALQPSAEDARGEVGDGALVTLERAGLRLSEVHAFELNTAGTRALILDREQLSAVSTGRGCALLWLDMATGALTLASGRDRGTGPALTTCEELAYDESGARAFVVDVLGSVLRVDLASGDRVLLADATTPPEPGGGPALRTVRDLVYDTNADRLLIPDFGANLLLAVDPATGVRVILSNADAGTAIPEFPRLSFDASRDVVYVVGTWGTLPFRIDLADGTRTLLAQNNFGGNGLRFGDIAYDPVSDRILGREVGSIVEIDLTTLVQRQVADLQLGTRPVVDPNTNSTTGDMLLDPIDGALVVGIGAGLHRVQLVASGTQVVSSRTRGAGPDPSAQDMDFWRGQLYTAGGSEVLNVDVGNGNRSIVADDTPGTDEPLRYPESLVMDAANERILVNDNYTRGRIIAVSTVDGVRTVFSDATTGVGTGPSLSRGEFCDTPDNQNGQVLLNWGDEILALDLATGDRSLFSGAARGTGPLPTAFEGITLAGSIDRYVTISGDSNDVLSIHRTTGDRKVLSGASVGSTGPALIAPIDIHYDGKNRTVIVLEDDGTVIEIDTNTGHRRTLTRVSAQASCITIDDQRRLLAAMPFDNEIIAFELATRSAETVASWGHTEPGRLIMEDLASGSAYWADPEQGMALKFDLATGLVSRTYSPNGGRDSTNWGRSAFLDPAAGIAYPLTFGFFSSGESRLMAVDLSSGETRLVSGEDVGGGEVPGYFFADGAFDSTAGRALVLDNSAGMLLGIALDDGFRTNLSGDSVGSGDAWVSLERIVYDPVDDRALVLDDGKIISVDLANGNRVTLSGGGVGGGDPLVEPRGLSLDTAGGRLLVRDDGQLAFIAVDLDDGSRTRLFTDPEDSPFSSFNYDYDPGRRVLFIAAEQTGSYTWAIIGLLEVDELSGDTVLLNAHVAP